MSWSFYFFVVKLIGGRYLLFAGLAFILAYIIFRKQISIKKIQQPYPKSIDYIREIGFSLTTIAIFSLIPLLFIRNPAIRIHTNYYTDINQHGLFYFIIAFPIMLILHDTYFYWAHRLMHHPALFRIFHLVHHKSVNPSPWAAYAFHPLEAIVEGGIVILFLFTIPIHSYHLPFFFLFMIIYNVYGHMGWELYPKGFNRHWLGRWVNTAVNHNQHHQYFKGNYGLYFLFWDRIMGTIREDYDQQYDEVKSRSKNSP